MELYKGAGDISTCASYRDIALGDITGKVYHSRLRAILTPGYSGSSRVTQCGGIARRGADF
eukprot:13139890-Alexandrium_andersonii.AAC.1